MKDYQLRSLAAMAALAGPVMLFEHGLIELKPFNEAKQPYPKPTEHYAHRESTRKYRRGKKHRLKGLRP